MKILMLASHFPPYHGGGYGRVAGAFAVGLMHRGHSLRVLTRKAGGEAFGPEPALPVVRVLHSIDAGLSAWKLVNYSLANVQMVQEYHRDFVPEIVLSCGSDGIGYSTYEAVITAGCASLTYLGDTWLSQAWRNLAGYDPWADFAAGGRRPGIRAAVKRAIARVTGKLGALNRTSKPVTLGPLTAISQFVVDDLRLAGAPVSDHVPLTYVPLDQAYFQEGGEPIGPGRGRSSTLRALFVSRVEILKGPDVAIAGVAAARCAGIDVTLTIAGMGIEQMQPALEAQARLLTIENHIRFAGTPANAELVQLYRNHDVFLFSSRIVEGLGLVNCEAQACGLPIIGTANSGAAEVIRHSETGFRIAIDDYEAMARHLGELARNRTLWEHMSANALLSAKRFHPDRILDTLEKSLFDVVRA